MKKYQLSDLRKDALAGITVGTMLIPQGMAYAAIAELPILYGIICSAIAAIVAPLFAGSRHTILGPTNATALMFFSFFAGNTGMADRWQEVVPLLRFSALSMTR